MDLHRIRSLVAVSTSLLSISSLSGGCVNLVDTFEECANFLDETLLTQWIDVQQNEIDGLPIGTLRNAPNFRALTMNIGNMSTNELGPAYNFRMGYRNYEQKLAERIQSISPKPHVISVQEALTPHKCETLSDAERLSRPDLSCYPDSRSQVERLLGEDYQIVCDGVGSVDCLAVLKSWGRIEGATSDFVLSWEGTAPVPPPASEFGNFVTCTFSDNECVHLSNVCDEESSVSGATIAIHDSGERIRTVWMHPTARGKTCQEAQFIQAFQMLEGTYDGRLMLGDWNFDPVRPIGNHALHAIFDRYVSGSEETPLHLHTSVDNRCELIKTAPNQIATLDYALTDFAHGWCQVYSLERSPWINPTPLGTLDYGILEELFAPELPAPEDYRRRRMDHAAVLCDLYSPQFDRP